MSQHRLTVDEAIQLGTNISKHQLTLIESAFDQVTTAAFAGGLATGARNWVAARVSAKAAYELMQGLAGDVVEAVR